MGDADAIDRGETVGLGRDRIAQHRNQSQAPQRQIARQEGRAGRRREADQPPGREILLGEALGQRERRARQIHGAPAPEARGHQRLGATPPHDGGEGVEDRIGKARGAHEGDGGKGRARVYFPGYGPRSSRAAVPKS